MDNDELALVLRASDELKTIVAAQDVGLTEQATRARLLHYDHLTWCP
ncbi:hypothetical protein [Streptomyces sp. NPDC091278]